MNYYYDIILDFQDNNYHFYDVDENDCFEYVKKIPIFQISNKALKDIINFNIKLDITFLKSIYNKTALKNEVLEYACLFADKNNCVAVEFDQNGKSISRSFLSLEDELNIIEIIYTVDLIDLKYEKLEVLPYTKGLRKEAKIKKLINLEIRKLYKERNLYKLQFLYLEWFGKNETNIDKIISKMQSKLNKEIGDVEEKVLKIIKMSYNNV